MAEIARDLRAEADELRALLEDLDDADWSRETPFLGWTPWDVVAHLHYFDRVSLLAATDPEGFAKKREELFRAFASGETNAQIARRELGPLPPDALVARWHETCRALAETLGGQDPKRRLPWFGPDMGVRMFTTARFMETWAHAQDVYDLLGRERTYTDRIRHVAELGVRTYGWTFANRKLPVPGPPPYVRLVAPSGGIWEWNDPSETSRVEGSAAEFCHVVTQGRNVADTELRVVGDAAAQWMAIAQCFAGPPADPPAPGTRGAKRGD